MALWGWVQIQTLDQLLVEQQGKRLSSVAGATPSKYANNERSGLMRAAAAAEV